MGYISKEDRRKYQREWVAKRRALWVEEHGPCSQCGSDKDLEVDHIDPDTKHLNPGAVWSLCKSKRGQELAKCQVLCGECHKEKTSAFRKANMSHGKERMYRDMKCRCPLCKEWKRLKSAKEYQRRKSA